MRGQIMRRGMMMIALGCLASLPSSSCVAVAPAAASTGTAEAAPAVGPSAGERGSLRREVEPGASEVVTPPPRSGAVGGAVGGAAGGARGRRRDAVTGMTAG